MPLKPLPLPKSLLHFGIPAVIAQILFWKGAWLFDFFGLRLLTTYIIVMSAPSIILFLAALWFYRRERNRTSFTERMRLQRPNGSVLAMGAALFVLIWLLKMIPTEWLQNWIDIPKVWVRMTQNDADYFMDFSRGSWQIPAGFAVIFLSCFAGELWWRGIVFPRQELAHGARTWVIHGVLWAIFRSFNPWDLPWVLPSSLALSYAVQRTRSTWPAIIAQLAMSLADSP